MVSSLFHAISVLRPSDENLSDRERWRIQIYRLLSGFAFVLIPVFGVLYRLPPSEVVDPWWLRLSVTGLFGGLLGFSYFVEWIRRRYTPLMWGCLYVLVAWVGVLAALNEIGGGYAVALLFVFCVVGVCIGIGIDTIGPLLWFFGYGILLVAGLYGVVPAPKTSPFVLVGCITAMALILYVAFQALLLMQDELRAAKEEAEAASQLKSSLLANMSHEVRTPLTSILGFAELIANDESENPEALAHRIRQSGRRLLNMLDSVLRVSRLESGGVELQPEPLDLAEVVADRVNALVPMAERNDVHLEFCRSRGATDARLDVRATKQIVGELVRNAIDFSEAGDEARVSVRGHSERVTITVEDTGVGMEEERLETLFRPFEQASVGRDRPHEGAGLGLTVAHRLIRLMDGTIEVETEKGEGTRVIVRLPRRVPEAVSA